MIERTQHDDVTALRLSWPRSRLAKYGVHVFVVRGAMIDSGFPGAWREVRDIVQSYAIRGALLTHHHEDHAGNVQALARAGVPLAIDGATRAIIKTRQPIGFYRHFTWRAMQPLSDEVIPFSDNSLSLVPTPGHCDNHHAVWDDSTGTLFAGDLFLGVKVRVAHVHENPRALVQSLRAMAARSPARMFCAHRGFVANPVAALFAKAEWLQQLIYEVDERIARGEPVALIAREIVGRRTLTDYFSAGDYSALNVVRAIRDSAER